MTFGLDKCSDFVGARHGDDDGDGGQDQTGTTGLLTHFEICPHQKAGDANDHGG